MTWTMRACAASVAKATVEAGTVKSSTPWTLANTGRGSSVVGTPRGLIPATSPMSRPIAGEPLASTPPATTQPGVSASARVSVWPMRPAAPSTAILMSLTISVRVARRRARIAATPAPSITLTRLAHKKVHTRVPRPQAPDLGSEHDPPQRGHDDGKRERADGERQKESLDHRHGIV